MKESARKTSSFTVIVVFVCLTLTGLALGNLLPVKLHPDHSMPELTISFSMPKASASLVESELSSPLEKVLSGIAGLTGISSHSSDGMGVIRLSFDKYVDIERARFEASTRIRSIRSELPRTAGYPTIRTGRTSDQDAKTVLSYSIGAPHASSDIETEVERHILPLLREVDDIGDIILTGGRKQEYLLAYDPEQIRILGISPDDIATAIGSHFRNDFIGLAGIPDSVGGENHIRIRLSEEANNVFDLSRIFVPAKDKSLIPISRLLTIRQKEIPRREYYRVNGLNSIYLRVLSSSSANQIALSKQIGRIMDDVGRELPEGYRITKLFDSAESISLELNNILVRSGITILLLLLFTLITTRNVRYMATVTISLIANVAIAFAFYYLFGLEIQLYTLAAITISLSFIIDNSIVMIEHLLRRGDRSAITAILAATLTTVSAMIIVFFLPEAQQKNLGDFARVIIINLCVSIIVALFLVPSLFERLSFSSRRAGRSPHKMVVTIRLLSFYSTLSSFLYRRRRWVFIGFAFLFGLPLFLLPKEIEDDTDLARLYNNTIGSTAYRKIRPYTDVALGGTLRPFLMQISSGSEKKWEKPVIHVNVQMPVGSTADATNEYVTKLERFLAQAKGISYFETSVTGERAASIGIHFKDSHARGNYPYDLHQGLVGRILNIGGGYCRTYGLENVSFSNIREKEYGSNAIKLTGYNYDALLAQARLEAIRLSAKAAIRNVSIASNRYSLSEEQELHLSPYERGHAFLGISPHDLVAAVNEQSRTEQPLPEIIIDGQPVQLAMAARTHHAGSKWMLENSPLYVGGKTIKLKNYGEMQVVLQPQAIVRENKNYVLYVLYNHMGTIRQSQAFIEKEIQRLNAELPIGYKAMEPEYKEWENERGKLVWALIGIIVLIFFITSILFDSLYYTWVVLSIIPISFIGIFIVFSVFRLPFEEGGFAAMILLCGITVNASIYLINDYLHRRRKHPSISPLDAYRRAVRNKTFAILLTVISTVLGFVPFVVDKGASLFWHSLSMGVIFGLLFSTLMLFLILPCFLGRDRKNFKLSSTKDC